MQPTNRNRSKSFNSAGRSPDASHAAKLFVGGLSYDTTDSSLQRYFEEFGEVESAVVLRDPTTLRSRGFGFVTFVSTDAANQVVACTRHLIDGRKVEAKFAVPRSASIGSTSDQSRTSPTPKSVDSRPSAASIHTSMPYSSALSQSPPTLNFAAVAAGRSKSIDTVNSASNSVRDDSYNDGALQSRSSGSCADDLDDGVDGSDSGTRRQKSKSESSSGGKRTKQGSGIISNKIFVGGLLYATHHGSLRTFFEKYGSVETAEVIYNRDTKKSRGFGFVVFQEYEPVARVLADQAKNLIVVDGKQVEVKRCVARQESVSRSSSDGTKPRAKSSPRLNGGMLSPVGDCNDSEPDNQWAGSSSNHGVKSFASVTAGEHQGSYSPSHEPSRYTQGSASNDEYFEEQFTTDDFYYEDDAVYRKDRTASSSSSTSFFNAYGSPRANLSPYPTEYVSVSPGNNNDVSSSFNMSPSNSFTPLSLPVPLSSSQTSNSLEGGSIWSNSGMGHKSLRSPTGSLGHEGEFSSYNDIRSSSLFSFDDPNGGHHAPPPPLFESRTTHAHSDFQPGSFGSSLHQQDHLDHFDHAKDFSSFLGFGETQSQKQ